MIAQHEGKLAIPRVWMRDEKRPSARYSEQVKLLGAAAISFRGRQYLEVEVVQYWLSAAFMDENAIHDPLALGKILR